MVTWGYEGDGQRLFLRGQFTLVRLVGPGWYELVTRFQRCAYFTTGLQARAHGPFTLALHARAI